MSKYHRIRDDGYLTKAMIETHVRMHAARALKVAQRRERVLELYMLGVPLKDIAAQVGLSRFTVRLHLRRAKIDLPARGGPVSAELVAQLSEMLRSGKYATQIERTLGISADKRRRIMRDHGLRFCMTQTASSDGHNVTQTVDPLML